MAAIKNSLPTMAQIQQLQNSTTVTSPIYNQASVYYPSSGQYTYAEPSLYFSDEWTPQDAQDAGGQGWMLTNAGFTATPTLKPLHFGAKKAMTDDEVLQDVLTNALTGDSPIAYKVMCILTKNRSPYAEFADTVKAVAQDYE